MANPEHLAILKQGVEVWNRWRTANEDLETNLQSAELAGMDLRGVNFYRTDLSSVNLAEADLSRAVFRGANALEANFRSSLLSGADFMHADITGSDLTRAGLINTSFVNAQLRAIEMSHCLTWWTTFGSVDLSETRGLEYVQHLGPSVVDIQTISKSRGRIPQTFLRGAGVPENFLDYARVLIASAAQFYSCFISYSTKDQIFADRLHSDLQTTGVRCWFAPHDIKGGKKIHEQIDEAITAYDRLLLILSDHSMNSEWVKTEIANARQREMREKRQMLFPISLVPYEKVKEWRAFDADTGKDSAREIREYFIPDFSDWKDHDSYQQAFQRLLRDLKAEVS
jgi:hypothetical protein